jgi:hypothetical protein
MTRGQTYYYHADGLGSITGLTDCSQALVQQYGYDGYGNSPRPPRFKTPTPIPEESGTRRRDSIISELDTMIPT